MDDVDVGEYKCRWSGCSRSFHTNSGRIKHEKKCKFEAVPEVQLYEKVDGKKIKCTTCGVVLSCLNNYYRHRKLVHERPKVPKEKVLKVFQCASCPKTFKKLSKLKRHETIHTKPHVPLTCGQCGKGFQRLSWYERHIETCNGDYLSATLMSQLPINEHENEDASSSDVDYYSPHPPECAGENIIVHSSIADDAEVPPNIITVRDDTVPNEGQVNDEYAGLSGENFSDHSIGLDASEINGCVAPLDFQQPLQKYSEAGHGTEKKKKNLDDVISKLSSNVNNQKSSQNIVHECRFASGVLDMLASIDCRILENRDTFCSILYHVYGDEVLESGDVSEWLSRRIGKRPSRLQRLVSLWLSGKRRGRHRLSDETKNAIYHMWHFHSILSVDRRNNRDVVCMKDKLFSNRYEGITFPQDSAIEIFTNGRKTLMRKAPKRIATKTIEGIQKAVNEKHVFDVSYGSVVMYKPFYVLKPTEREKLSCQCKFCLNIRLRFRRYEKHLVDPGKMFHSVSKFFGYSAAPCEIDENGYFQLMCISGECGDCQFVRPFTREDFKPDDDINFNQFVVEKYAVKDKAGNVVKDKKGKDKLASKTVRRSFTEKFSEFEENLYSFQKSYLLHQFECYNERYHWPIIKHNHLGLCFHMDYSENIANKPKEEPQDAHFGAGSSQLSLHCTVVHPPENPDSVKYAYHLSDDRGHDTAFTSLVIDDLIAEFGALEGYEVIRFKSDNCSTQYCCQFLFYYYAQLATKLKKTVIVYYGVNGHGKGLVDAMSGFGVKTPIRRAIVTQDYFYSSSQDVYDFLVKEMAHKGYYYKVMSSDDMMSRRNDRPGIEIVGCRKTRMIAFLPSGKINKKRHICSCEHCKYGLFNKCSSDDAEEDDDFGKEDVFEEEDQHLPYETIFESVYVGSYIALHSAQNSFEPFLVIYVKEKGVAEEDLVDFYGHVVMVGESFITGVYLERKDMPTKKGVPYKKHKRDVFILPGEVSCPGVTIDEKSLMMTLEEYNSLASML